MITFYAPKWAIDLVQIARSMDTTYARLLAMDTLQSQVDCPDELATDMVYETREHEFEESGTFRREESPKWTHAVFNGEGQGAFRPGKLYRVRSVTDSSFDCLAEDGIWRFCLREDCAFVKGGNWTLVNMEESELWPMSRPSMSNSFWTRLNLWKPFL